MKKYTYILGISAYYHDSGVALIKGEKGCNPIIVAAAQEERFTRKKQDAGFPSKAIEYCLTEAGISLSDLELIVFYDKPLLKFERLLETYYTFAPRGLLSFIKAMPVWLKEKLLLKDEIMKHLTKLNLGKVAGKILFPEHHLSHAASAFYPSPFEEAAIITVDGVGEYSTTTLGKGSGNQIEILKEIEFPHSLGLLYSAFTYYTGFKVNSGEYKIMGLAPYGEPKYVDAIYDKVIKVADDGSFRMNMKLFNYATGLRMTSKKFDKLVGGKPRKPESTLTQREMDLAASVQVVTEEIMIKLAKHAREITGAKNLVLAGGVALNCVANGKVLREKIFDDIWIQPAAGDAGGALGAALAAWHTYLENPRKICKNVGIEHRSVQPEHSTIKSDNVGTEHRSGQPKPSDENKTSPASLSEAKPCGGNYSAEPPAASPLSPLTRGTESQRSEDSGGEFSENSCGGNSADSDDAMQGAYLGPKFSNAEIEQRLVKFNAVGKLYQDSQELFADTAKLLNDGKIIGWLQGRMEFGPRALGNRSIIGDARNPEMQKKMNLKIKFRESFRPFAPSCQEELVNEYFNLNQKSPYMLLVDFVQEKRRKAMTEEQQNYFGIEKLNVPRSDIPAITHIDYSARIQTVSRKTNPRYWELLEAFRKLTGYGIFVNTSFNVRGEPIVCTPEDAYRCFMRTEIDYLVLGDWLLAKPDQPEFQEEKDWRKVYQLD